MPYADAHTAELIERSGVAGLSMPTYPWVHPSGWIRRDTYDAEAVESGSMFPGFTLDQLRDHVLDRFDVALAVANPDEAASFSVLPIRASRPDWRARTTTGSSRPGCAMSRAYAVRSWCRLSGRRPR